MSTSGKVEGLYDDMVKAFSEIFGGARRFVSTHLRSAEQTPVFVGKYVPQSLSKLVGNIRGDCMVRC
eukprot:185116-Hanusia_phi.AAC.1